MYLPHPSRELSALFAQRPFQGVEPAAAVFLFVGLDANYAEGIERSAIFRQVVEYHQDGVAFWHRYGVHHPFLLPQYSGDGRRYHRNFARIGFAPDHAALVSFVELLHVPTVGRNKLVPADLDSKQLRMLNSAILSGRAQHIFVSSGVARLMRASKEFPWLSRAQTTRGNLPVLYDQAGKRVYSHLHFSNYGRFQAQLDAEAQAIASLLPRG